MKHFIFLVFGLICFICLSCNLKDKSKREAKNNIIASVGSKEITFSEVDELVKQELFDELNRIYTIREIALEELISNKILELESEKNNTTIENLVQSLYSKKINDSTLELFCKVNGYGKDMPVFERSLTSYKINSKKGYLLLKNRFEKQLLMVFVDSLRKTLDVEVFLKPPSAPSIKTNNLVTHYKGNLDSKVSLLVISDLECDMCRKFAPIIDSLYLKYENDVRFGFTHYSSYASLSAIASECAAKQDKFWQMHDSLIYCHVLPDTNYIFQTAKKLDMDMKKFYSDFQDEGISKAIEANNEKIGALGIYGTPTIVINGRIIFNSSSLKEIEQVLLEEMAEVN